MDEQLRPVPVGIPGELFTGGDGLAIGYHAAPELTAEKFINHPTLGRLYRTGDRCRWAAGGTIEFIGRRDHQVKVRGFRIEPGEIENVLATHPDVRQVKVAVRGENAETKRILAWVILHGNSKIDTGDLDSFLATRLPAFMRPDAIAAIDTFPLNVNGKILTNTLPDPAKQIFRDAVITPSPPIGETEQHLATIWSDLLGIQQISRDEDFFTLGGHSLMALRMFSRITREFGRSLPLAIILKHPTIATLATALAEPAEVNARPSVRGKGNIVLLAQGGGELPLFCIHGGDGGVMFYRSLASLMPPELPVHAIESLELGYSGKIQPCSIEETAAAYVSNMLKIQPTGPFRLAGYSFGGVVAHEIACQLIRLGHEVQFLGLFDTHNPASYSRNYNLFERLRVFWRQNSDLPLWSRVKRVRARVREGIHTKRRVKAELKASTLKGPAEAYSDLRRVQVREENWRAMQAYQPGSYSGRITLFKTSSINDKVERPEDYGWACLAGAGLDIVSVEGDHLSLFAPENISTLADGLSKSLCPSQQ